MKNLKEFYNIIEELGLEGEQVADLFINWEGAQILTDEFMEYLEDELA